MIWRSLFCHQLLSASQESDHCHRHNGIVYLSMRWVSIVFFQDPIQSIYMQILRNHITFCQKKLRTTNKYSFQSCMTECTVDTILNKCDCLPFYYPESSKLIYSFWALFQSKSMNYFFWIVDMKAYSKKYRQCSLHDVKCLRDNRRKFRKSVWWFF